MSWTRLPTRVRLEILQHHLRSTEAIDRSTHLDNLVWGDLEVLISTQNMQLVQLSLEAYYTSNTFVVKPETVYKRLLQTKVFRPRTKHALMMKRLIDETAPPAPVTKVSMSRADSGVCLQDSAFQSDEDELDELNSMQGSTSEESAPDEGPASHGLYWAMHRTALNRSARLNRLLEKRCS
ncbi:hypothetical protein C7974DRAFT_412529 [Boeremia exigua]|uniref:uncharacterized protein n=1 Tax=Boeremia exigua TaxID=749465 RepID=UPI001E8DCBDE|nr:uncharacterized protein C7974DRAFT_412529 [Boeremia exigua]KAH6633544.1 hypothetical protein C7974DRAFT_412529 [Boeremia exigua]